MFSLIQLSLAPVRGGERKDRNPKRQRLRGEGGEGEGDASPVLSSKIWIAWPVSSRSLQDTLFNNNKKLIEVFILILM